MKSTKQTADKLAGFAILEVILALALFSMVATAMTIALDRLATTSMTIREESLLLRRLESELVELSNAPELPIGVSKTKPDAFGVSVRREISPYQETSQEGLPLEGLFHVQVTATMDRGSGVPLTRTKDTLVIRFELIQPEPELEAEEEETEDQRQPGGGRR